MNKDQYEKPACKPEETTQYQPLTASTMQGGYAYGNVMCAVNPGPGGPGNQEFPPKDDEQISESCT